MNRPFNDDDRETRVGTSDGRKVRRVREIDTVQATVEQSSDDSLTDEIRAPLGWSEEGETHDLRRDHVDRYGNDERHRQPRR